MSNPVAGAARRFWSGSTVSVRDGLSGKDNALGIIRLALAVAVIFSHAFPLGGWGDDPVLRLTRGQENFGGLAVLGFFAISGYLIAKSGMKGDVVAFLWHRVLRIFPAFWTVLLVTAFVVGPIAWLALGRPLGGYFVAPLGPFEYLRDDALLRMNHFGIADLFLNTPYGATAGPVFNGSLWTLEHEFFCYLVIAFLVLITVMARPKVVRIVIPAVTAVFLVIRVGIQFWGVNLGVGIPFLGDENRTKLVFIFLIGSCIAVFSRSIKFDDRLGVLAILVVLVTGHYGGIWVFGIPALAYAVLWLGARLPRSWRWIGAKNDYSYGIYVYGFLIEQILAALGVYRWGYVPYVAIAIVITAGCAWLSWHGVEKRALALKDRGPGRGISYWRDRLRAGRPRQASEFTTQPAEQKESA